jgi:hypothetical protein
VRPVVERCLRIDPDHRYDSVTELLEALGQTPRQGDSVRLRFHERKQSQPQPDSSPAGESAAADKEDSSTGDELKQAAAELARGAVGIARGVFTGVRDRISKAEEEDQAKVARATKELLGRLRQGSGAKPSRPPLSGGDMGGDIVSVSTLDEPDAESSEPAAPASTPPVASVAPVDRAELKKKPWFQELVRSREEKESARQPGLLVAAPPVPAESLLSTVPVPPPAEGGWVGSVSQSVIVGAEIMGALVTGPLMMGLRSTAAVFDRVVRGVPGVLGGRIRLIILLVLMALLGALVSFIILGALAWRP